MMPTNRHDDAKLHNLNGLTLIYLHVVKLMPREQDIYVTTEEPPDTK